MKTKKPNTHPKMSKKELEGSPEVFATPYSSEKMVYTQKMLHILVEEAVRYVLQEQGCLKLQEFFHARKIPYYLWKMWVEKYDFIKLAHNECISILGTRREKGMLIRALEKDAVMKTMHRYDEEWVEIDKYHANLKNMDGEKNGFFLLEIPKQQSTGKVKPNVRRLKALEKGNEQ